MHKNNQKSLVYFFILIISFYLFFVRSNSFSSIKFIIVKITAVPIKLLSFPLKEAKKILYYNRTHSEYVRLRKEVDVLKARMIGLEEVIKENSRLEKLLDFKRRVVYSSVAARVIGRNPSYWNSSMIIDKGEKDGIQLGMPVVNASGVVGKIAEIDKDTSNVVLLTDPNFSVAALIKRPRENGLISGTLQGVCRLSYINSNADIRVGDKVITSKLSSSFPEGLFIGEIIQINEDQKSPSLECFIKPAVSFSQIEEVIVIMH